MWKPTEPEARVRDFIHVIEPYWGEADPAGIIYTGRFTDYALRAIDAWLIDRLGAGFYKMNTEWGIGTPFVHTEVDLRAPAKPGEALRIAVFIERIGRTSLTFGVQAHGAVRGRLHFEGRFVCVCVESFAQASEPRAIDLDPRIRAAAEADLRKG